VAAASGLVAVARDAAEERDALRERAAAKRVQRLADSIAVSPRAQGKVVPERSQAVVQSGKLWVEISGPLTADSLGKLLDKVKPIRPSARRGLRPAVTHRTPGHRPGGNR